jgi:ABC-type antimicrobial peptide transport system permease subunit
MVLTVTPLVIYFSTDEASGIEIVVRATIIWPLNISLYVGLIMSKVKNLKVIYVLLLILQFRLTIAIYHRVINKEMLEDFNEASLYILNFTIGLAANLGNLVLSLYVLP